VITQDRNRASRETPVRVHLSGPLISRVPIKKEQYDGPMYMGPAVNGCSPSRAAYGYDGVCVVAHLFQFAYV